MKARIVPVLMVTLSVSASAAAQTVTPVVRPIDPANGMSLDAAIARAIEQEPSFRAARSAIDVALAMRTQAGLRPNPMLSFEQRIEPGGTDAQTSIGAEWPLDLLRRGARVTVAEKELETAELSIADRRRLIAAEVRARYGDALALVRELAVLDELVAASRRQLQLLGARVEEGASPPLERDVLSVEVQRLESQRAMLSGRRDAAIVELKRSIGMMPDEPLALSESLEAIVERESSPRGAAAAAAVERRPDVREAAARVGVAEARIDRARAQGRLDVSVFANYMRMDAGFPQSGIAPDGTLTRVRGVFHYLSAGASVTVPLLNRNQGEVAAARAERGAAVVSYEGARLAATADIAAARVLDDRARAAVRILSTGARTLARQNLSVVGQSYELGRATVFDVLNEQRRYLELEAAYSDALRAAFEARTALRRALGEQP